MKESEVFEHIKLRITAIQECKRKPIRVAINGIEGTGKTVFAGKLTTYLKLASLNAIQVSIDGFHFNRQVRYRQGRDSARGYYEDSYDELAFVEKVLKSSQSDKPNYTSATHNLETDEYLDVTATEIDDDAILITDGAYLFKPNYRAHWDLKIYLKTSFEIAMSRGVDRDKVSLGGFESTKEKYEKRYHKASQIYVKENEPEQLAHLIIDNSDFNNLKILRETPNNSTCKT